MQLGFDSMTFLLGTCFPTTPDSSQSSSKASRSHDILFHEGVFFSVFFNAGDYGRECFMFQPNNPATHIFWTFCLWMPSYAALENVLFETFASLCSKRNRNGLILLPWHMTQASAFCPSFVNTAFDAKKLH